MNCTVRLKSKLETTSCHFKVHKIKTDIVAIFEATLIKVMFLISTRRFFTASTEFSSGGSRISQREVKLGPRSSPAFSFRSTFSVLKYQYIFIPFYFEQKITWETNVNMFFNKSDSINIMD